MSDNEQLDDILDEALGEYRQAEPLAGIESRILARIHAGESGSTNRSLRWAIALACGAAIAAAVWFGIGRRIPHIAAPPETATGKPIEKAVAPTSVPTTIASASRAVEARKAATRTVLQTPPTGTAAQVKPAVFPSPTPLSAEERAFTAALNRSASVMLVASEPDKAITIAEIVIKPLDASGSTPGGDQ
jgi:hypothetical protein